MPGAPGAVFPVPDAGGPGGAIELELATPTTGDVDHLVRELGCGQDGCRKPVKVQRRVGGDLRDECEYVGFRIKRDFGAVPQAPVALIDPAVLARGIPSGG